MKKGIIIVIVLLILAAIAYFFVYPYFKKKSLIAKIMAYPGSDASESVLQGMSIQQLEQIIAST